MVTDQKITYTTMSVDQAESFNRRYDEALTSVLAQLGKTYPMYVGDRPRQPAGETFQSHSPNDRDIVLGTFQEATKEDVRDMVLLARRAFPQWSRLPWRERLTILRKGADIFRARKFEIAAWLALEAGKTRLEAMGEVEEAADLITTYCQQMEDHDGYVITLNQLSPQEINHSVLRPYGVFAVIAPFNFPVALATGMIAGALIGGNTVVFKPSPETPMCGLRVLECLADAGLPSGTLTVVTGSRDEVGKWLTEADGVDGVAFIGSVPVGTHIYREFSHDRPRPVIAEMGGKNPVIVTASADLDKAVEGTARAAFGYSGQKCSAASRVYVQAEVEDEFLRRLAERTAELVVDDPTGPGVFTGPVIDQQAYRRFQDACEVGRRDGEILCGGTVLTDGHLARGYYCGLTVCRLPKDHRFFREELFIPFLAVTSVSSLKEAIDLANSSDYGLTAGIFSERQHEIDIFLDRIEAGVVYVNRKGGATTGAWPGVQSFGGWKASGSTGKSALGPHYVPQFMREQSRTVVKE